MSAKSSIVFLSDKIHHAKDVYYQHYHKINAACITPICVLRSLDVIELPWTFLILLIIIYILLFLYKVLTNKGIKISRQLFSYTIKGHRLLSPIFWMIIAGIVGNTIALIVDNKQRKIDEIEYEATYSQYESIYASLLIDDDVYKLPFQYRDFAFGLKNIMENDYSSAVYYMKRAATNIPYASYIYGVLLYTGHAVKHDESDAINYLIKAADKEVVEAKLYLMRHYAKQQKYDLVESYGLDIIEKNQFNLPKITVYSAISEDVFKSVMNKCNMIYKRIIDCANSAYTILLGYYWTTEQYDKAKYISDIIDDHFDVDVDAYQINKALSILKQGDKFAAKRYFRKLIRKYDSIPSYKQSVINEYAKYIFISQEYNPRISLREARKVESLLISNIRAGNINAVSLLKELYERTGYTNLCDEMSHLESYFSLLQSYEEK